MWWRPGDQSVAEEPLLDKRTLGKGWRPVPMVNNVERTRPLGDDAASNAIEAFRSARVLTGLDEGRAFRHRKSGSLVVIRSEVFADEGDASAEAHRAAWHEYAEAALDATWRERWRERDRDPGWIEARWVHPRPGVRDPIVDDGGLGGRSLGDLCDWVRIEDHTPAVGNASVGNESVGNESTGDGAVMVYEHLSVWADRRQVTVVIRHDVGLDLDDVVARCAVAVERRLTIG